MSSSATPAFPSAEPRTPAAVSVLRRAGVLALASAAAGMVIVQTLPTILKPLPVAALLPTPPAVVARTPVLSTPSPEVRP